jgi:hypothetical protein
MKRCVALVFVVCALVCGSAALGAMSVRSVPFHTVARGGGSGSAATKRAIYVAGDKATWRRLWRQLNRGASPQPRLPRVDFSRDMVILVTQGQKPSGGYDIRVKVIRDTGSGLVVTVEERAPGAYCVEPQVITAPYHAVRVRRTGRPVVVERRTVVFDCPASAGNAALLLRRGR